MDMLPKTLLSNLHWNDLKSLYVWFGEKSQVWNCFSGLRWEIGGTVFTAPTFLNKIWQMPPFKNNLKTIYRPQSMARWLPMRLYLLFLCIFLCSQKNIVKFKKKYIAKTDTGTFDLSTLSVVFLVFVCCLQEEEMKSQAETHKMSRSQNRHQSQTQIKSKLTCQMIHCCSILSHICSLSSEYTIMYTVTNSICLSACLLVRKVFLGFCGRGWHFST